MRRAAVLCGGGLAAILTGLVVTLTVAWLVAWPVLFLAAGFVAGSGVWVVAVRVAGVAAWPWRITGALVAAAMLAGVLVPLGDPVRAPATPPGAGTWRLADGQTLAYGVVHAPAGLARQPPILVVHGGPGVPDLAGELAALAPLAADGHDVWAYAQLGSGASSRLSDPRGYTMARAVEDLEQVRLRIGAPRLILVGHSYGAFLVVSYLAAHPDRVEKLVFSSPGDLDPQAPAGQPQSRLDIAERLRFYALLIPPRALLTYFLVQVNPAAAHALAGDREVDARQDRLYAAALPGLHCEPPPEGLHGLGFYANQMLQAAPPDVRPAVRGSQIPALVIKGQCDYLDWQSAMGYLDLFPDSTVVYLPGAGHEAYLDRPEQYVAAVRAFLAGATVPGTLPDPRTLPADYQP